MKQSRSFYDSFPSSSANWLTAALDPFHDYQYDVDGLPDERSAPSVCQVHNQSYTLTCPPAFAAGTWDASVLFTGMNSPIGVVHGFAPGPQTGCGMMTVTNSVQHSYDHGVLSPGVPFGALNLWAGGSVNGMCTGAPCLASDVYTTLGSVNAVDRCRLIGAAVEIANTTAEVYKQGSLTVAQLPDVSDDTATTVYRDVNAVSQYNDTWYQQDKGPIQACTLPPLLAVPGSQTWPAAQGCYFIPRMTRVPREVIPYLYTAALQGTPTARVPVLYGTDGKTATPEPNAFYHQTPLHIPCLCPIHPNGFSPIQVYMSGLSAQSTLTITFRTIVEYFPTLGSPLLPLAQPSAAFDPKALALYSHIVAKAPYAVPIDENADGDYFRKILKVLSQLCAAGSPFLGAYGPAMGAMGTALSVAGDLLPKRQAAASGGQTRKSQAKKPVRKGA